MYRGQHILSQNIMPRIPYNQANIMLLCKGHAHCELRWLCRVDGIHRSRAQGARPRGFPAQINRWARLIGRIAIPHRGQFLECGIVPLGVDISAFILVVIRAGITRDSDWEVANEFP